jgi:Membrane protein putatively involved in post-translational modification of the autoinducing quorum-sensing peptide
MMKDYLQANFGYTDYQIEQIRYTLLSILSEISKLFIMGLFFAKTHHISQYFVAIIVLLILRTCTGGLHLKHYLSCLLVSFLIFYLGICQLSNIALPRQVYFILLLVCVIINYLYAPVVSIYRPIPNGIRIKKSKRQAFAMITLYAVIMFIVPSNQYIITGFWIIQLQTLQLIAAKIQKRRCNS